MNIAVIGASADRSKFGNKCVRAYLQKGHKVFPVHPKADEIEGQPCYSTLGAISEPLDRVSLYLSEALALPLLADIAKANPEELWLNPGADSLAVVREAERLKINTILGCSIVDIGVSPAQL